MTTTQDADARAVPLPRDGSLFGWAPDGEVTTLVAFDKDGPNGAPGFSAMPHENLPAAGWPAFRSEPRFGPWFWDLIRDGRMVDLSPVIASTEGAVFWVPTPGALGAGCIGVARHLDLPSGQRLPSGLYVYHGDLSSGMALPDWPVTTGGAIDLGPRFREV